VEKAWRLRDGVLRPGETRAGESAIAMTHWPLACCGQIIDDQQIPTHTRPFVLVPEAAAYPLHVPSTILYAPVLHFYFFTLRLLSRETSLTVRYFIGSLRKTRPTLSRNLVL
jgi:hypothetical protein